MIQQILIPTTGTISVPVKFNGICRVKLIKIDVITPPAENAGKAWCLRSSRDFFGGIVGGCFYFCSGTGPAQLDNFFDDNIIFHSNIPQWIDINVTLPDGSDYGGNTQILVTMDIEPINNRLL